MVVVVRQRRVVESAIRLGRQQKISDVERNRPDGSDEYADTLPSGLPATTRRLNMWWVVGIVMTVMVFLAKLLI
jgi:hypothetical protein